MKKANDFLQELQQTMKKTNTTRACFQITEHPAIQLDEYMKEQYFITLFASLLYSEMIEESAISYLIMIAQKAEFEIDPVRIVKNVFSFDDIKMQDCSVSFRDEEIKYLLGFELYITVMMQAEPRNALEYLQKIYQALEISQTEQETYCLIYQVLLSGDLSKYSRTENYLHSHILQCYLNKLDFIKERVLVVSNCLKEVRTSSCDKSINYIATVSFMEAHFISDYTPGEFKYVEKNTSLGHFIAMVGGFSLGADGRKWEVMEEEERRLITPKFKEYDNMRSMFDRDYYQDNTYEVCDILAEKSGVFYFIYNGIGAYNDPFAVISHPLDDEEKIKKYLDDCIDLSRSQNE